MINLLNNWKEIIRLPVIVQNFFVQILNEKIWKNKDIHAYYMANEKRWIDLQSVFNSCTHIIVQYLSFGRKQKLGDSVETSYD